MEGGGGGGVLSDVKKLGLDRVTHCARIWRGKPERAKR